MKSQLHQLLHASTETITLQRRDFKFRNNLIWVEYGANGILPFFHTSGDLDQASGCP